MSILIFLGSWLSAFILNVLLTSKQIIRMLIITLVCAVRTLRTVSDKGGGLWKVWGKVSKTILKFHKAINVYMYSAMVPPLIVMYWTVCGCAESCIYTCSNWDKWGISKRKSGKLKDPARSIDVWRQKLKPLTRLFYSTMLIPSTLLSLTLDISPI